MPFNFVRVVTFGAHKFYLVVHCFMFVSIFFQVYITLPAITDNCRSLLYPLLNMAYECSSAYRVPRSQPFYLTHSMWRGILQLLRRYETRDSSNIVFFFEIILTGIRNTFNCKVTSMFYTMLKFLLFFSFIYRHC